MRPNKYILVYKIVIITVFTFINGTLIYGQDRLKATVALSFKEETNIKTIIATAKDQLDKPIKDLDLYFYTKRTFSLLPIGDGFYSTDTKGEVEVKFPNDLPGDTLGNVTIVVKIKDSDLYNDSEIKASKNWGIKTNWDISKEKRSLSASAANAPVSLIISVNLMIFAIWLIICYIIFTLYKISKIKPVKH